MRGTDPHYRNLVVLLVCLSLGSACNLAKPTPTPFPTPDLPQIQILAPPANQRAVAGTDFDIDILAVDHSGGIQRIELHVDDLFVKASELDAPKPEYRVTMNWYAQGIGWHSFTALAYRADGTRSDEAIITLEVIPRE